MSTPSTVSADVTVTAPLPGRPRPAIPTIGAYPMPTDLPANRIPAWPQPERALLLLHDLQHYFLRAYPADSSPLADLMSNVMALREACASARIPIAYSLQPGNATPAERGLLADFWGLGMSADPADTAVPAPLRPQPGDLQVAKTRYSALHGTALLEHMRALGRDHLIICGVYAHIGILTTALDAFMHDIRVFAVADAMADFSAADHERALTHIAQRCGHVLSTAQAITSVRRVTSRGQAAMSTQ